MVAKILSMANAGFGEAIFKIDIMAYIDKSADCLAVDAGTVIVATAKAKKLYQAQQEAIAKEQERQKQLESVNSLADSAQKASSIK